MSEVDPAKIQNECPVCNSRRITPFIDIPEVPVHCNALRSTREDAINALKGVIRLAFCADCAHIFNTSFDPTLMNYDLQYETSLHHSPYFQAYAGSLAARLAECYDLHGKCVMEIGCGKGDFLISLCKMGGSCGIGFDPSCEPERVTDTAPADVTFIQDLYSEKYRDYQADLIICRHVLEHIQFPGPFLGSLRRAIDRRPGAVVFFEVPNVMFTLRDLGIWDLIYEHCSYFNLISLAYAFGSHGFEIHRLAEDFGGQVLQIESRPANGLKRLKYDQEDLFEDISRHVWRFSDSYSNKIARWKCVLQDIEQRGKQAVVWGAGSKGVTLLNVLGVRDGIDYVIDINPRKHGKYVAGTGQKILPPESLIKLDPDVIIIMNPIYCTEIRALIESLNLHAEVLLP